MSESDSFHKKEKAHLSSPQTKKEEPLPKKQPSQEVILNRREDMRYLIEEIPLGNDGKIIEMSRKGARVLKGAPLKLTDTTFTIKTSYQALTAELIWQDDQYLGLKITQNFDSGSFLKQNCIPIKESAPSPPETPLSYYEISKYKEFDALTPLINLMAELESPNTNFNRLKQYIIDLHEARQKIIEKDAKKNKENAEKGITKSGESPEQPKQATVELEPLPDLKEELIKKTLSGHRASNLDTSDVDCIIARLGLDAVRRTSSEFVKKNLPRFEGSLPGFRNYQLYSSLKTIVFRRLSPLFGYLNDAGEGSSLLSLEVSGIRIFLQNSKKDLSGYYTSPSRLYSEVSRSYERLNFGIDLLNANKTYFEKVVGSFQNIYDGYPLAHLMLNPYYRPDKALKCSPNKSKLLFAFVAYLTFLALKFIIEKDTESGNLFLAKLQRTGMDRQKALAFLNECTGETNRVLSEMGIRSTIPPISSPASPFKLQPYVPANVHFDYLLAAFQAFGKQKQRIAIRYDDEAYAHFILDKLLSAPDFELNSKIFCILPCDNLTEEELYLEDLTNFDLLIFKNIDKLPAVHQKRLIRLWSHFEGKIIGTLSARTVLDHEHKELYACLKHSLIDFPSYRSDLSLYRKMVEHTLQHLKQFFQNKEITPDPYLAGSFSMDDIKAHALKLMLDNC